MVTATYKQKSEAEYEHFCIGCIATCAETCVTCISGHKAIYDFNDGQVYDLEVEDES